jgi:hypothetical protein
MQSPEQAYNSLRTTINDLEEEFLATILQVRSLNSLSKAELFQLSAFIVLSHAAFEECFEALASWGLHTAVEDWRRGHVREAALALLLHFGKRVPIDDEAKPSTAFERVRAELDRLKSPFSTFITRDSHGISLKYLMKLFYPLGVDIPNDMRMLGSLETFTELRGFVAHRATRGAKKHLDPGDTRNIVMDCLDLAAELKKRVLAIT